ncbi:MAG: phosphoribosylaminoimidazolesuccinocarboxamide synthase [Defluviitaleaceae bacterium]|nr:phosphoribosylaminoimidazolesuccinocarboxamide synthase [Defluviitaleaceae bacterium]
MNLVYSGKTKDVYSLADGNYLLKFKDDATGKDGVFDPGENTVALSIDGLGRECLALSQYFFTLLENKGVPTHFVSANLEDSTMVVRPVRMFGRGLEVVCRFRAVGSFLRRYGDYIAQGAPLDALVEFTLKNDEKGDPPITRETLAALGIMTEAQYEECKGLAKKIGRIMADDLQKKGLTLYDMKLEFGMVEGKVVVADEISAGCMRVYKGDVWVQPMDLNSMILG